MATPFDLAERLDRARAVARALHHRHGNSALARLVETLGFDRTYVRGQGQYLWDSEGVRVLDCLAGYGALAIGRDHPVVRDALAQCLRVAPPAWVRFELNPLAGEAARMLKEQCGAGLDHVFFVNSGTEGVEAAIKLARRHTGRPGIVAWSDAFHGLSCGALSLNGSAELQSGFGPLLADAQLVPFGDLEALESVLRHGTVAAVFVEPVQGKTLQRLPPGALRAVQALCHAHGTLLVADEVQTGVGRTGRFLATHHDDVQADIVVLSKALCGGFVPVGAVLVRADVWRSTFSSMDRAVVHSSTLHEGPLAMTALIATLEVVAGERLVERAAVLGAALQRQMSDACAGVRCVRAVRGLGCMVGVELDSRAIPRLSGVPFLGHATDPLVGQAATMGLLAEHAILAQTTGARRPVLKFLPPMTIVDSDVEWLASATASVCAALQAGAFFTALGKATANLVSRSLEPG